MGNFYKAQNVDWGFELSATLYKRPISHVKVVSKCPESIVEYQVNSPYPCFLSNPKTLKSWKSKFTHQGWVIFIICHIIVLTLGQPKKCPRNVNLCNLLLIENSSNARALRGVKKSEVFGTSIVFSSMLKFPLHGALLLNGRFLGH